ncbi:ABC transporter ATP-binding protein [Chitinibacter bivalviorum]|uniref:ABC transporter ATP-binding protein n=1 Tax=Chitinibacter bivalviorum TaxID=2739434 RepID=A0A7H9BMP5_9NEIS|nr:ABC transporter ATP-binding protein [Chitinibacter bivalviorum]QLG89666.1 ABC transporter ATP-binding protein [Chitinibacter bivalviorum]
MTTPAIELSNLSKSYRSLWGKESVALSALNLEIQQGEVFGFVGPNGAGKSTTIKIIMGLLQASSGSAQLYGKDVRDADSRTGIAYVPESALLNDYLTPLDILESGCHFHNVKTDNLRTHCLKWLERYDIANVANKPLRSFSKGMTQRTALAHAMAIQPKLLILDEPLSGLDPLGRKLVLDILAEYRSQGGSIFFSSHVLYDVERLADRYGLIHKGKLRTVRSPAELLGDEATVLITSYGKNEVAGMQHQGLLRWQGEIKRSVLWATLEALEKAGHEIHEVRSTTTLEQAFLDLIKIDTQ